MHLVTDLLGEIVDHLRVGKVLALRGGRHHQVVLHQPDDQATVPGRQLVTLAEVLGIHRPQLGMVAVTPLADVVVQPGQVDQLRLGQAAHDLAGQWEFLRNLGVLQLAQVLDQVERVRIHRIDVEQVVLHLPDDMAELGQVAAEDAVAVHATQVAVNAHFALEQLDEQAGVADIVAERIVDQVAVLTQQADGVRAYALDLRVLRHQHEDFQHRERSALEHLGVSRLDIAIMQLGSAS